MQNYVTEALKTESVDLFKVDHPRLLHAAMGIGTEFIELLTANPEDRVNLKEELGDILWYLAIIVDALETTFEELETLAVETLPEDEDGVRFMFSQTGELLDQMKKACAYGVPLNTVAFGTAAANILRTVREIAKGENWSLADIQEANIAKLRRRYGEKFTTEAATHRNTEAERVAVGN